MSITAEQFGIQHEPQDGRKNTMSDKSKMEETETLGAVCDEVFKSLFDSIDDAFALFLTEVDGEKARLNLAKIANLYIDSLKPEFFLVP
jgi:hypothetical protein